MIIPSKHDGYGDGGRLTSTRRVFMDGGGSQPTSQSVTQTSIPEYARPYVESMLGKASALTNTNTNPYMQYQGERFAQFTPLQQQSYAGAATMAPATQLGAGSNMAAKAGQGGMDYGNYTANSFTQPGAASAYMSPYMQNVTDMQMQSARRQDDISRQGRQAQAVGAGAFGGSRQAIQEAEANRALNTQLGSIQAQGLQGAFNNAQQQFNTEQQSRAQAAGIGLQGLSTGLQGASTLGQLGQNQYSQEMGINQLQQQLGAGQQAQMQNILTGQQQDYLNAQNYPYKQLSYMSDMLRGMPLSQTSQSMYQSPGNQMAQLAGIGLGVSGLMGKAASGGSVSSYAEGGAIEVGGPMGSQAGTQTAFGFVPGMAEGGVTDPRHVEGLISKLTDQQLKESLQIAVNTGDKQREETIREEMAMRASEQRGMAAAYNQQPQGMMAEEPVYSARGGIVAFAEPTDENNNSLTSSEPEKATSTAGRAASSILDFIKSGIKDTAEVGRLRKEQSEAAPGLFEALTPSQRKAREERLKDLNTQEKRVLNPEYKDKNQMADFNKVISDYRLPQTENIPEAKVETKVEAPKLTQTDRSSIKTLAQATSAQSDVPFTSAKDGFEQMYGRLSKSSKDHAKTINDKITELTKLPEFDRNAAIAKFGFQMAAAASQPGTPGGLAGIIQAAGKAAPSISESLEAHNKDVKDLKRLGAQMTIEQAKYEAALERDDKRTAMSHAQNLRMMEMQMAQLVETKRSHMATENIHRASLGQKDTIPQIAESLRNNGFKGTYQESMEAASKIKLGGFRTDSSAQIKRAEALSKLESDPLFKAMPLMKDKTSDQYKSLLDDRNRRLREINKTYPAGGGGDSGSPEPTQRVYDWKQQTGDKS
jgi:hypothetical protein